MKETLKLMESIITGKEKNLSEESLIKEYQSKYSGNILAYFFKNNYGDIVRINNNYIIIDEQDKASFCLQELDKALRNFNKFEYKFNTYFHKCYINRLRMEAEQLNTYKRKANIITEDIQDLNIFKYNDIEREDVDSIIEDYNLSDKQTQICKLVNDGFSNKEIAKKVNLTLPAVYWQIKEIRQKILNSTINFV